MNNHCKKLVTEFTGFLVFSRLTISQYHCFCSLPYLSHFYFIYVLYYLDVIYMTLVAFIYILIYRCLL